MVNRHASLGNGTSARRSAHAATPRSNDSRRNRLNTPTRHRGVKMTDMGSFRIDIEIENPGRPGERRLVRQALVDTGAELSWVPGDILRSLGIEPIKQWSFRQATGQIIERWVGGVTIHAAGTLTNDDVVFGEPGDLVLLGARTLEGLNVRVEPREKRLVDAGPAPAAAVRAA
jgi:predicted aspartyl protease